MSTSPFGSLIAPSAGDALCVSETQTNRVLQESGAMTGHVEGWHRAIQEITRCRPCMKRAVMTGVVSCNYNKDRTVCWCGEDIFAARWRPQRHTATPQLCSTCTKRPLLLLNTSLFDRSIIPITTTSFAASSTAHHFFPTPPLRFVYQPSSHVRREDESRGDHQR